MEKFTMIIRHKTADHIYQL